LACAGFSVAASQYARLRRSVDYPISGGERFEVAGYANVTVEKPHTQLF
jgi:hypothetical protein